MIKNKFIDESGDKRYFTIIPNYILNHSTLWDREVYIQMKRITGENGTCWTSQTKLSKQCGISINRLKKSLQYLIKHRWISLIGKKEINTKGGIQLINEYRIIDLWDMNNNFYKVKGISPNDIPIAKGVSPDDERGITNEAKGVSPDDDKEEPCEEEPIKKNIIREQSSQDIPKIIELFKEVNPSYKKWFRNTTQRGAIDRMLKEMNFEQLTKIINFLPKTNSMKYAPVITTPLQLEDKMASLIAFIKKEMGKSPLIIKI